MTLQNIQQQKIELAKRILQTEDKEFIRNVQHVADSFDDSWWNSLPAAVRRDVELSMKEAENGETIAHSVVKKKYAKWLAK